MVINILYGILMVISIDLIWCPILAGQNLVPNNSFEEFRRCPIRISMKDELIAWKAPTKGTTDYLNMCATNPAVSIPANQFGFSYAHSGNGYIGISNKIPGYREYIQCRLNLSLKADSTYYIEFWVTLAERSSRCINELGISLTKNRIIKYDHRTIDISPQVRSSDCITDTANWVRISGTYLAQGGERWITIGCFTSGKNALMKIKPRRQYTMPTAYYFIDDVYVGLIEPEDRSVPPLPQDTVATAAQPRSFILPGVLFATGKSELSTAAHQALDAILGEMRKCSACRFEIIGHTDDQGSEELNQALSQARASEVGAYFKDNGIAAPRIDTSGRGADKPLAANSTEQGRAQNRRVEIMIREE